MTYSFYRFTLNDIYPWIVIAALLAAVVWMVAVWRSGWRLPFQLPDNIGLRLLAIFAMVLTPIWFALILLVLWNITAITFDKTQLNGVELRWHTLSFIGLITALGALVSAPLAIIRVFTNERQTKTAEDRRENDDQVLINQRIQGALEQLSARYTRTRMGRTIEHGRATRRHKLLQWHDEDSEIPKGLVKPEVGDWEAVQFSEPDIQTRLSGIGQFEAIIKETEERGRAINEHLANFIRANSPAPLALPKPEQTDGESDEDYDEKLELWANGLSLQADIQAALSLIARSDDEALTESLDLRQTCLQGAELIEKSLKKADLRGVRLEGANFWDARLEAADLGGANLEGANLEHVHLEGAHLGGAHLDGADLGHAQLEGASLEHAHLKGAQLRGAHLERAELEHAGLEGANLVDAHLEEADLRGTNLQRADLGGAHLEGAKFWGALLKRADLIGATFDKDTKFNGAVIQYATVKSSDFSMVNLDQTQVDSMFGDGTMTVDKLPNGISRPGHWPEIELNWVFVDGALVDRITYERDKWAADPENYVLPTE